MWFKACLGFLSVFKGIPILVLRPFFKGIPILVLKAFLKVFLSFLGLSKGFLILFKGSLSFLRPL